MGEARLITENLVRLRAEGQRDAKLAASQNGLQTRYITNTYSGRR